MERDRAGKDVRDWCRHHRDQFLEDGALRFGGQNNYSAEKLDTPPIIPNLSGADFGKQPEIWRNVLSPDPTKATEDMLTRRQDRTNTRCAGATPHQRSIELHHHLRYRAHIDGLRAIALLGVVVFHFGATWLSGGFIGVDVFFVISGFLISKSIYREIDSETFSIGSFYERRARRIAPAFIVVTLIISVLVDRV